MLIDFSVTRIIDHIMFALSIFLLTGSIYISFKTRFVQLRLFPYIFKMFLQSISLKERDKDTVLPHKALLTAMSTTLGIGTIAGPIIAIHLGGPGALLGFLLTSILGSAATFTEVNLCIKFKNKSKSGFIIGGPMGYLKKILSPMMAKWYAISCCMLMTAWSGAQANQLAVLLDSSLLGNYRINPAISGIIIAILVLFSLLGGIKRISSFSAKIVPLMFILFLGSSFWILFSNIERLPSIFATMFYSAFSPYAMASGTLVGGLVSSLRWGIFKGTQATEAGIGTQTIPHSMTNSEDAISQGILSMISTYTAGFMAFLSGCVVLITDTWQNTELSMGISMIAASFQMCFSTVGVVNVVICTFLFGFGTSLGNSYNGSQCFAYLTENPNLIRCYFFFSACVIFVGSVVEVKTFWSVMDIFLACMAVPHMFALMRYVKGHKINHENPIILNA